MKELKQKLSVYREYTRTIKKIELEILNSKDEKKINELKQKRNDMQVSSEIAKHRINNIINKYVIKYEYNKIMHDYYIDNLSIEDIAEKENYSERYIWKIIKKSLDTIHKNSVNTVDKYGKNVL